MTTNLSIDPAVLAKCALYPQYIEAKLGFRNHWYPTLLSEELKEGEFRAHALLGDKLLLTRSGGKVQCVRDRCLHRGVPFSRKVECYKPGTVTCWYHGFTYNMDNGELCDIITHPKSNMIGKLRIPSFRTQEAQGLIFVFLGDIEPPPLSDDVPPGFLDTDQQVCTRRVEVNSNWRLGCENGFDSTHIFIHKDSPLVEGNDLLLPLGLVPTSRDTFEVVDNETGPKGVFDHLFEHCEPIFEGKVGGKTVLHGHMGATQVAYNISMWLPCALRVMPWPGEGMIQFEWYVPIDADRHFYFQAIAKRVTNDAGRKAFIDEFNDKWCELALKGFNNDDIWAREAQQLFYVNDEAWTKEHLFEADRNISQWRQLASRRNRGLQRREHLL